MLPVKVTPKGGRDCILPYMEGDEGIKLKVAVPPEGGKANAAVLALLASELNIAKSKLAIVSGTQARQKQVGVTLQAESELNALILRLSQMLQVSPESGFTLLKV